MTPMAGVPVLARPPDTGSNRSTRNAAQAVRRQTMRWMLAGLLFLPLAALPDPAPGAPIVFTDVTVVDVRSGRLVPARTVVVAGTKITVVAGARGYRVPPGATVVPGTGKF